MGSVVPGLGGDDNHRLSRRKDVTPIRVTLRVRQIMKHTQTAAQLRRCPSSERSHSLHMANQIHTSTTSSSFQHHTAASSYVVHPNPWRVGECPTSRDFGTITLRPSRAHPCQTTLLSRATFRRIIWLIWRISTVFRQETVPSSEFPSNSRS